jgi:hypothetical protein
VRTKTIRRREVVKNFQELKHLGVVDVGGR